MNAPTYQQLEDNIVVWLQSQSSVRAALIVGSRARIDRPADQWSDLDFIFFVTASAIYEANTGWLAQFGAIGLADLEHSSRGDAEWILVYADGRKLDVLLATSLPDRPIDLAPYTVVIRHGARIVLDRTGQLQLALQRVPPIAFTRPTAEEFSRTLRRAWLSALRAAKFARRSDLWRAKQSCDCELKQFLLTMLEWHAHVGGQPNVDTWHDGRYLSEWADRAVIDALPATFAAYDRSSIQHAVRATIELLHRLAQDVAAQWSFNYPASTTVHIVEWIRLIQQ